jgi:hypothetical protein
VRKQPPPPPPRTSHAPTDAVVDVVSEAAQHHNKPIHSALIYAFFMYGRHRRTHGNRGVLRTQQRAKCREKCRCSSLFCCGRTRRSHETFREAWATSTVRGQKTIVLREQSMVQETTDSEQRLQTTDYRPQTREESILCPQSPHEVIHTVSWCYSLTVSRSCSHS